MRVFSSVSAIQSTSASKAGGEKIGHREVERQSVKVKEDFESKVMKDPRMKKYSRPSISESEVREKLQKHVDRLAAEKAKNDIAHAKKTQAKKAQMAKDAKGGEVASETDVKANDPTDTNTREKLKEAVTMGTFAFSDKERQVLNKILASQ